MSKHNVITLQINYGSSSDTWWDGSTGHKIEGLGQAIHMETVCPYCHVREWVSMPLYASASTSTNSGLDACRKCETQRWQILQVLQDIGLNPSHQDGGWVG